MIETCSQRYFGVKQLALVEDKFQCGNLEEVCSSVWKPLESRRSELLKYTEALKTYQSSLKLGFEKEFSPQR